MALAVRTAVAKLQSSAVILPSLDHAIVPGPLTSVPTSGKFGPCLAANAVCAPMRRNAASDAITHPVVVNVFVMTLFPTERARYPGPHSRRTRVCRTPVPARYPRPHRRAEAGAKGLSALYSRL